MTLPDEATSNELAPSELARGYEEVSNGQSFFQMFAVKGSFIYLAPNKRRNVRSSSKVGEKQSPGLNGRTNELSDLGVVILIRRTV